MEIAISSLELGAHHRNRGFGVRGVVVVLAMASAREGVGALLSRVNSRARVTERSRGTSFSGVALWNRWSRCGACVSTNAVTRPLTPKRDSFVTFLFNWITIHSRPSGAPVQGALEWK